MQDNLPVIDYKKCTGCLTCVAKCPRHIIISRKVVAEEIPAAENKTVEKEAPANEEKAE